MEKLLPDHLKYLRRDNYGNYPALLAKSTKTGKGGKVYLDRGVTLFGHTKEALEMAQFLLYKVPFGRQLHKHLGLWKKYRVSYGIFCLIVQLAVLLHDIGKSGMVFQDMIWNDLAWSYFCRVTGKPGKCPRPEKQVWRHEALSLWLINQEPIRPWLLGIFKKAARSDDKAKECLLYLQMAVLGHHLKRGSKYVSGDSDMGNQGIPFFQTFSIYRDLTDVIPDTPTFPPFFESHTPMGVTTPYAVNNAVEDLRANHNDREANPVSQAIQWTLILSDVLGSINPRGEFHREGVRVGDDLREHFIKTMYPVLVKKPIDFRENRSLRKYDKRNQKKNAFNFLGRLQKDYPEAWEFFQKFREEQPDAWEEDLYTFQARAWQAGFDKLDATLYAGCGGGKTIAALFWASQRPWLRLITTTPTMATATQLLEDYGDKKSLPRHSRSWLDYILLTTDDPDSIDFSKKRDRTSEMFHTLNLFDEQGHDAVFCTVDQVLGVLANRHGSIMWLPYMLQSQIVFDELDSYDKTMAGWYLRFLSWFPDIPTFHMSATMTNAQREAIQERRPGAKKADLRGLTVPSARCKNPDMLEPRYIFHVIEECEAAELVIPGTLWINQQVDRAQRNAKALLDRFPNLINFHSRFRYKDRWALRKALMAAFPHPKMGDPISVAVATQMAEISLNIYGKRLISEIGPIYAMIQRLGRVNRALEIKGGADVFFYMPPQGYPYVMGGGGADSEVWREEFKPYLEWVKSLADLGRAVSQAELMKALQDAPYEALNPVVLLNSPEKYLLRDYRPTMVGLLEADVQDPEIWRNNKALMALEIALPDSNKRTEGLEFKKYRYILPTKRFPYDLQLGLIDLEQEDDK